VHGKTCPEDCLNGEYWRSAMLGQLRITKYVMTAYVLSANSIRHGNRCCLPQNNCSPDVTI